MNKLIGNAIVGQSGGPTAAINATLAGVISGAISILSDAFNNLTDAASSIINLFKGNIVYINVMKNMSVDCDCCAKAEDPCMNDIGILSSTDPVALDQACIDLVYNSKEIN